MNRRWRANAIGLLQVSFLVAASGVVFIGCPRPPATPTAGETRTFAGIEFQWCPAGTFTMGSPANETGRNDDEGQHSVTLTQGFWLGRYEVTQRQWEDVMGSNPAAFNIDTRNPVETVSWDDVQAFIAALNAANPDVTFRLPTEAEWEYACRANTTARFYWGDDAGYVNSPNFMWFDTNSGDAPRPFGGKMDNPWGLGDTSGNVWEWCSDRYGAYPMQAVTDPTGVAAGADRVMRGGSWSNFPWFCRAAARASVPPDTRSDQIGLRLAITD